MDRSDDLKIPVGDEIVAASRFSPTDASEPLPTLLMYIPYHKDALTPYTNTASLIRYLVHHDYHVVVADIVGTGASTGFKAEPGETEEGTQAAQIIDWIAERQWSTGSIGMFGISYGATTSLRAAAENPEPLKAIVPIHGHHTQYRETAQGGSFSMYRMGGNWGPYMQVLAALPPVRRDPAGRWSDIWNRRLSALTEHTPWLFQFLEHESKDEYWLGKDVPAGEIGVPTFAVCGWRDRYARATIEYFEAIDSPGRLLLGPWRHTMPQDGRETAIDFRRQVVEWFDHFLRGEDSGARDRPEIAIWTERDGGGKIDAGTWRRLDGWPTVSEETDTLSFALSSTGLVESDAFAGDGVRRTYDIDHSVGVHSLDDLYTASEPADTNPDDRRSLTFETPSLESPVEFTGTGQLDLRVEASTPDPYLVGRVIDVAPDGGATLVTHGEIRATHRNGFTDGDDLIPGEEYRIGIPLKPKSHVFEANHRIRVAVSGAYFPLNLPPRDGGELTLRSTPESPSLLRIPGSKLADPTFQDGFEMDPPDETVPLGSDRVHGEQSELTVARERQAGNTIVETSNRFHIELPHALLSFNHEVEATVADGNPSTARIRADVEAALEYESETVRVAGKSNVSRDVATMSLSVSRDGDVVFDHDWRR